MCPIPATNKVKITLCKNSRDFQKRFNSIKMDLGKGAGLTLITHSYDITDFFGQTCNIMNAALC